MKNGSETILKKQNNKIMKKVKVINNSKRVTKNNNIDSGFIRENNNIPDIKVDGSSSLTKFINDYKELVFTNKKYVNRFY